MVLEQNSFDCIVVLNSELNIFSEILIPINKILEINKEIIIIAADGAYNKLFELNISPNYVIGDLDSVEPNYLISSEINHLNTKFIKLEEQETNDFEKCLKYIYDNKYRNVLVIGLDGGLLEHTLNNWSVFTKFSAKLNLIAYSSERYAFNITVKNIVDKNIDDENINSELNINLSENEIVSLIPINKCKLSTKNLKWELNSEYLELGVREGARNITNSKEISIKIEEGSLLFFCNERLPFCYNLNNF